MATVKTRTIEMPLSTLDAHRAPYTDQFGNHITPNLSDAVRAFFKDYAPGVRAKLVSWRSAYGVIEVTGVLPDLFVTDGQKDGIWYRSF